MNAQNRRAFTLIELLIVVAIIAILAAIAVPNFLEAQVRSKVSRVKSDQRTIATALESYFVDNNKYPGDSDNELFRPGQREIGLLRLTSPVAYLTTLARDPFASQQDTTGTDRTASPFFEMGCGSDNYVKEGMAQDVHAWVLISLGTDVAPKAQADDTSGNDEFPGQTGGRGGVQLVTFLTYDPTNGTISDGDIYRAGGQLNQGNYTVNGKLFGNLNN